MDDPDGPQTVDVTQATPRGPRDGIPIPQHGPKDGTPREMHGHKDGTPREMHGPKDGMLKQLDGPTDATITRTLSTRCSCGNEIVTVQ